MYISCIMHTHVIIIIEDFFKGGTENHMLCREFTLSPLKTTINLFMDGSPMNYLPPTRT